MSPSGYVGATNTASTSAVVTNEGRTGGTSSQPSMGPVNLVVGHRQELGLRPLLHWLVRERRWVQTHRSVSWCAVDCVGSPFSRE
jgi:hypothetical protein